ncbi:MAG: hypothetical protein ACRDIV_12785, partial [Ktedonobacteraceae bacterium]
MQPRRRVGFQSPKVVSIAQARHPSMQRERLTRRHGLLCGFNRSSATSLYATPAKGMSALQRIGVFQSLKRDIPLCNSGIGYFPFSSFFAGFFLV